VVLLRRGSQVALGFHVSQPAEFMTPRDGSAPGGDLELAEDVRHVSADCAPTQGQHLGNVLVGVHPGHEPEDLLLPGRQRGSPVGAGVPVLRTGDGRRDGDGVIARHRATSRMKFGDAYVAEMGGGASHGPVTTEASSRKERSPSFLGQGIKVADQCGGRWGLIVGRREIGEPRQGQRDVPAIAAGGPDLEGFVKGRRGAPIVTFAPRYLSE
jgi:hypothetical protein